MATDLQAGGETLLARIGRLAYRRRRPVAVGWLALFAAGILFGSGVFGRLATDVNDRNGSESQRAYALMRHLRSQGPTVDVAAFVRGRAGDRRLHTRVVRASAAERRLPGVAQVLDPYGPGGSGLIAADHSGFLVAVDVSDRLREDAFASAEQRAADRLSRTLPRGTLVGGEDLVGNEMDRTAQSDLERAEMIALPLILVIMLIVFRSVRLAVMPIVVALVSIAGSLLLLLGLASVTQVSIFAVNVVTMLGLGLAVDYTLLAIGRFREERGLGRSVPDAVERAVARAGRTIVFSGLTVTVSLAGMLFLTGGIRSIAYGGIGVVLVAMLAAVSLVPALLGIWGSKVRPAAGASHHGAFFRLSRLVQRRAGVIVPVVVAGLALLAVPFTQARAQDTDYRYLPRSSESRAFFGAMHRHFASGTAEPIIVVAIRRPDLPAASYERFAARLRALPGVLRTEPGGSNARIDVVDVVPRALPQSGESYRLVRIIRDQPAPFPVLVTGHAAELVDAQHALMSRLPTVLGFVAVATFVLLFLMTGSVVVPLKALAMNVLSLGASFGALVWVFQDGHLSGLLGFDPTGSVWFVAPVLIFTFAFGLSMDYEVFLLGRIKESYERTGDNDLALATGLQRTGGVVTTAAVLMVAVFAGFAAGRMLAVKELGLGLALAVALDASVIRMLLVPATMKLMGRWNWWAPGPLRRLHRRFGLREEVVLAQPQVATETRELEAVG